MPNTSSAVKRVRENARKRVRSKSIRSQCKTNITKAEKLIFSGKVDLAPEAVQAAISALDKAQGKGIIHPNNASRRKSRLLKKLNTAQASSSPKKSTPAT
ncbi:MAG: 30S ribosomal protein S20 [Dehalococcoidales bacterium]|nr:30S ribosomal protein S20 [Dehalococcoidales bacterium]